MYLLAGCFSVLRTVQRDLDSILSFVIKVKVTNARTASSIVPRREFYEIT